MKNCNKTSIKKKADFNKIIAEISAQNKTQIQKIAEQQELNF